MTPGWIIPEHYNLTVSDSILNRAYLPNSHIFLTHVIFLLHSTFTKHVILVAFVRENLLRKTIMSSPSI